MIYGDFLQIFMILENNPITRLKRQINRKLSTYRSPKNDVFLRFFGKKADTSRPPTATCDPEDLQASTFGNVTPTSGTHDTTRRISRHTALPTTKPQNNKRNMSRSEKRETEEKERNDAGRERKEPNMRIKQENKRNGQQTDYLTNSHQ